MRARLLHTSSAATVTVRARVAGGVVAALLAVLGILVAAAPAQAHAELLSSDPADGSVLDVAPPAVTLTFSEPLLPQTVAVAVSDAAGVVFDLAAPAIDRQTVTIDWPADATAAGTFTVAYRVVSQDGHPIEGAIHLTVEGGTASTPAASPSTTASPEATTVAATPSDDASTLDAATPTDDATSDDGGSTALWLALGALAVAVLVVIVIVVTAGRRRS